MANNEFPFPTPVPTEDQPIIWLDETPLGAFLKKVSLPGTILNVAFVLCGHKFLEDLSVSVPVTRTLSQAFAREEFVALAIKDAKVALGREIDNLFVKYQCVSEKTDCELRLDYGSPLTTLEEPVREEIVVDGLELKTKYSTRVRAEVRVRVSCRRA